MKAFKHALLATAALAALGGAARATENGATHVDLGYFAILGGFGTPPGELFASLDYNQIFASRFNDRNGNPIKVNLGPLGQYPIKFLGNVSAGVLNVAYEFPTVLPFFTDAHIGTAFYINGVGARAEAQDSILGRVAGSGETIGGFGDATFIPFFLQFNLPSAFLHVLLSPVEFTAPTGSYKVNDPIGANVGTNFFSYRPAIVTTYLNPQGLELDLNVNASFNSTNDATHYKSGDEFSFTYAAIQHFSPKFGAGLEGYYYKQFTGDKLNGVEVNTVRPVSAFVPFDPTNQGPGNKGQVFAIGPAFTYNFAPTAGVNFRYQHEVFSDNRRQGEVLWAKVFAAF